MKVIGIISWALLLGVFVAVAWTPINVWFGHAHGEAVYGGAMGGAGVFMGYLWGRCWGWWNV